MDNYSRFFTHIDTLSRRIAENETRLVELLGKYEPYATAHDEIERSMSALNGVREEFSTVSINITDLKMSTFFPLNLPLYSLVLFAIIPSAFARTVFVRPPAIMQDLIEELINVLQVNELFPAIKLKNINRSLFLSMCAGHSDVILFTGRYENAMVIHKACPHALLIFNGGGTNPAIVFKNADVRMAAGKIAEMRTFNSGQDCAGTDVIFVHDAVYDAFVQELNNHLETVVVGEYGDPKVDVGPILKKEYIDELLTFLQQEKRHIVREGAVDAERRLVTPYIIAKPIEEHTGSFHEFFAPVFYILKFSDTEALGDILTRPLIEEYSMYTTYFGDNEIMKKITKSKLIHNQIINDVEQGNSEYGGYGKKANFMAFGNTIAPRPILISREINDFYLHDKLRAD